MSTENPTPETDEHGNPMPCIYQLKFPGSIEEHYFYTERTYRTLKRQRDEALTDRARFEQGVESLTAQLDALRAERDEAVQRAMRKDSAFYGIITERDEYASERDTLRAKLAEVTAERDEFQAELQKVCDHDWQHIDDSFDHEFGTEQVHSCLCEKCGATKPYEPETFGDEVI